MSKEFEIQGCVEVPMNISEDDFFNEFIGFIESNNWSFGRDINADGTKGKHVLEKMSENVHDNLTNELFQYHSLAALIYLINIGRELEFSYKDIKCFISKSGSTKTVSLWISEDEQAFDSIEALIENAVICNQVLIRIFHNTTLETLF